MRLEGEAGNEAEGSERLGMRLEGRRLGMRLEGRLGMRLGMRLEGRGWE